MKKKITIFGKCIDLDQTSQKVNDDMNAALSTFLPPELANVNSYVEIDPRTIEMEVSRMLKNNMGHSLSSCLNDHDMVMISGLPFECFDPYSKEVMVAPLIPSNDGMYYSPNSAFYQLWKKLNSAMGGDNISRIKVSPQLDRIKIRVIFKKKP